MLNKLLATRTVLLALPLLVLLLIAPFTVAAKSSSPYSSGYDHGCSDASLPTSEQYINQPGKGAEFHTGPFMDGYNAGHDNCLNNTPNGNAAPGSAYQGNGPNYSSVCQSVQPVLIQSCDTLVNGDGSLTTDGTHAMGCIKNGILLGGGASLLGIPLPIVLRGLSILAAPTGCDGIVDMSAFNSLGNIGSISSLLNSLP
jgi:hypothetical protein